MTKRRGEADFAAVGAGTGSLAEKGSMSWAHAAAPDRRRAAMGARKRFMGGLRSVATPEKSVGECTERPSDGGARIKFNALREPAPRASFERARDREGGLAELVAVHGPVLEDEAHRPRPRVVKRRDAALEAEPRVRGQVR